MIYFLHRPNGDIKIGTTIRLSARLKQLQSQTAEELGVLGILDGSYADEKVLHERFRNLRVEGEWFLNGTSLLRFIDEECRPWDGQDEVPLPLSVKLRMDVIESARIVAAYRSETITDMLSDILGPILAEMEKEEVAKRTKGGRSK